VEQDPGGGQATQAEALTWPDARRCAALATDQRDGRNAAGPHSQASGAQATVLEIIESDPLRKIINRLSFAQVATIAFRCSDTSLGLPRRIIRSRSVTLAIVLIPAPACPAMASATMSMRVDFQFLGAIAPPGLPRR
jgi:hypothetical protein